MTVQNYKQATQANIPFLEIFFPFNFHIYEFTFDLKHFSADLLGDVEKRGEGYGYGLGKRYMG